MQKMQQVPARSVMPRQLDHMGKRTELDHPHMAFYSVATKGDVTQDSLLPDWTLAWINNALFAVLPHVCPSQCPSQCPKAALGSAVVAAIGIRSVSCDQKRLYHSSRARVV